MWAFARAVRFHRHERSGRTRCSDPCVHYVRAILNGHVSAHDSEVFLSGDITGCARIVAGVNVTPVHVSHSAADGLGTLVLSGRVPLTRTGTPPIAIVHENR